MFSNIRVNRYKWWEILLARLFGKKMTGSNLVVYKWRGIYYVVSDLEIKQE